MRLVKSANELQNGDIVRCYGSAFGLGTQPFYDGEYAVVIGRTGIRGPGALNLVRVKLLSKLEEHNFHFRQLRLT